MGSVIEALEPRQLLAVYYVSAAGSDTSNGTSLATAWKTIARVNSATLHAGDSVLFRSGDTFAGGLFVGASEAGTFSAPVTFGSTGTTRATISSPSHGLDASEAGGIVVKNLNFIGPGSAGNSANGIYFHQSKKRTRVN